MSKTSRNIRVNELLRQELSLVLHTRFQAETVDMTLTEVDIAPDHRTARVYYSVIGDEKRRAAAASWIHRFGHELQFQLAKRVTLKHTPRLTFIEDLAIERGNRIAAILDELDREERTKSKPGENPA